MFPDNGNIRELGGCESSKSCQAFSWCICIVWHGKRVQSNPEMSFQTPLEFEKHSNSYGINFWAVCKSKGSGYCQCPWPSNQVLHSVSVEGGVQPMNQTSWSQFICWKLLDDLRDIYSLSTLSIPLVTFWFYCVVSFKRFQVFSQ